MGSAWPWCRRATREIPTLGSRLVASAAEERDKASVVVDGRWVWTGLWMEGKGRETGGAWVWTGGAGRLSFLLIATCS